MNFRRFLLAASGFVAAVYFAFGIFGALGMLP